MDRFSLRPIVLRRTSTRHYVGVTASGAGNVREFGVPALIGRGNYHLHDVEKWLWEHDRHPWSSGTQHYHVRGKSGSHDEQFRVLTEFVRPFPGYRVNPPGGVRTRAGNWAISHTFQESEVSLVTRQIGSME